MNFQDDIHSIPIDKFKKDYEVVFDLTSLQDATENVHNPELAGEPMRMELIFTLPLEHVAELIDMVERMFFLTLTSLDLFEKIPEKENVSLQQIISRISLLKYRYLGWFPFDYVPFLASEAFVFKKAQPGLWRLSNS